jgi:hypothetical protein
LEVGEREGQKDSFTAIWDGSSESHFGSIEATSISQKHYAELNDVHGTEMLAEQEGIGLRRETVI